MYWEAEKSILLYTGDKANNEIFGNYWKGKAGINQCKVGFINVLKKDNEKYILNTEIGNEIIEKLEIK